MAISSISSVTTITPQTTTPAQLEAAKSAPSGLLSLAIPTKHQTRQLRPRLLPRHYGSYAGDQLRFHHHKKPHHPAPGQPGYAVNKKA